MSKKPSLLWPTLLTLMGIGVLCALGFWQLHRLEWKLNLERQLDEEFSRDIAELELNAKQIDEDYEYRRGTLRGTYDFETQILIAPRTYKNLPGKHLYTVLRLEDGSHILVNRGWVPVDWRPEQETQASRDAAIHKLTGLLRKPERNAFTPENNPAKEQWYFADAGEIAAAKNIPDMHDPVLVLESQETEGDYPISQGGKPEVRNDHLQYAIFWFVMAGIMAIMYGLRFLRK